MKRHQHRRTSKALERCAVASKGEKNRRIISRITDEKYEYTLHATKGYRSAVK